MDSMVARLVGVVVAVVAAGLLMLGPLSSPAAAQEAPAVDVVEEALEVPTPDPASATELDAAWSKFSNLTWRGVEFAFLIAGGLAVIAVLLGHLGSHGGAAMASRSLLLSIAGGALLAGSILAFINFMINIGGTLWTP